MDYKTTILKEKTVVGLTAHTSNTSPEMGKVIGSLWERFFAEGIFQNIANKSGNTTIGLYSNYSNHYQDYDITIGCAVNAAENLPNGTTVKTIPAGNYAEFVLTVEHGDYITPVANLWEKLWQMPLERTFTGDFEEYYADENGTCKEIHIFIAIR